MTPPGPKDDDPTVEEAAPEFDGTKTVQLDDTYRVRVALESESERERDDRAATPSPSTEGNATSTDTGKFDFPRPLDDDALEHRSRKAPADVPTMIDKTDGYNPYDTIIETAPPRGFVGKKRSVQAEPSIERLYRAVFEEAVAAARVAAGVDSRAEAAIREAFEGALPTTVPQHLAGVVAGPNLSRELRVEAGSLLYRICLALSAPQSPFVQAVARAAQTAE